MAHSGVLDPRVADISLKLSWVSETRMELMIGERQRNILLTPTTNIPGWKTSCLFTGKLEGDLDSEVSVSGCHESNETMVSIASSLLPDGFVELMIVDGNTKNMENSTPDYLYPPADPFEWDVHSWSGPLPSTVVLKTDIKYDNSLLEHFDYSHEKTKDWIKDVVQLAKPMMSHNTLTIKVGLEIGEVTHIDETLEAENDTIYYLQQTKNHKSLTSYFCKGNRQDDTAGIAFLGTACNSMYAININELSYSDLETARIFAHELGHNIGMLHDFDESHGGHHGKCDHKGLMSYGQKPTQWSSCSNNDFTTWWKEKGHVCLKKTTDKHHEGFIKSENYPNNYPNNFTKTYKINADDTFLITFLDFYLEPDSSCDYDYLIIKDGDGSVLLPKTCGSTKPDPIKSNTNTAEITFSADHSFTFKGFSIKWETTSTTTTTTTITTTTTTTTTDSYDDNDYDTIEGTDKPDSSYYDDSDYDTIEGTDKPAPPNKPEWSEWAPWSDCYNNKMFRVRNCKHRTPSNGGALCPGPSVESKDCPPRPGPDSRDWGNWW